MLKKILNYKSNNRNRSLFKSISVSFIAKGLSVLCNFLFIPITVDYVNPTRFGIWLTLSSIIGWISLLDIGLGNGLKNGLAELFVKDDKKLARVYTSTAYITLGIFLLILLTLFFCVNWLIHWDVILNVPQSYREELSLLSTIVLCSFCCQFLLQLVTNVFAAAQEYEKVALANFLINFLTLLLVILVKQFTNGSLLMLAIIVCFSPILVYLSYSLIAFGRKYKYLIPSFKSYDFKIARKLFSVGLRFFLIQISLIVIYQVSNVLISNWYGAEQVTVYNIAQKYMSVVIIVLNIIMAPFWSAFTDAYIRKDIDWIRKAMGNLRKISLVGAAGIVAMIFVAGWVYPIWIGKNIDVPFSITLAQGGFFIINALAMPFVFFINGTGKIFIQTLVAILGIILFVPLAILFARYFQLGVAGIILSSIVCNLPMIIVYPIQYKKLLSPNSPRIWTK